MGPTAKEIEEKSKIEKGELLITLGVLIVGFDEDKNGEMFYLIQNSWGKRVDTRDLQKLKRNIADNYHIFINVESCI